MKLELKNVSKTYIGKNTKKLALSEINLSFDANGLYLITGRSGSGKTTILNLIAGYDSPTDGEIVNEFGKNSCAFVFQDYQLINYLTVHENLQYICDLYGTDKRLIEEYANKYSIDDILEHYPNEISGGEKQRVAIIRSFLESKPIILCDEPTGNLDEENADIIAKVLKNESKTHIVIVVSHDKDLFSNECDQMITIEKGKVTKINKVNELDSPNTWALQPLNLNLKRKSYLMLKFFKKNLFKHIMLMITLVLTLFLAVSALSTINNSLNKVLNNTGHEADLIQLDFSTKGSMGIFARKPYVDLVEDAKKYDSNIYYDYGFFYIENVFPERTYVGDKVPGTIIAGTGIQHTGDILISDYVAIETDAPFEELLNWTYSGLKVVGIYNTGFYDIWKNSNDDFKNDYEFDYNVIKRSSSWFTNQATFEYYLKNREEVEATISLSASTVPAFLYNSWSGSILYGNLVDLNPGEIGISYAIALEYASTLSIPVENLIGCTIDIKYKTNYGQSKYADSTIETYTVKYIVGGSSSSMRLILSEADFSDAVIKYDFNLYNYTNGVSLVDYDAKKIARVLKDGYIDNTAISETVSEELNWLIPLKYIELGVAVILIVVSIIVLTSFIHVIFEKEKGVQGLLLSFGIKRRKIVQMYLLEIFFVILISLGISLILEIPYTIGLNQFLVNNRGGLKVLYFEPLAILYIILILVFLMLIVYLIINRQMRKKEIIDMIYQR